MAPPAELVDEYFLFRAARYLGVAPWELLERSTYWTKRATFYEQLDAEITSELMKKHK